MSESGIFLDYYGPVDLKVIELLLNRLKKTKEFTSLNKTTGKRVYSLVVECLENTYKHSELKSSRDPRMQPHVSVRNENNKIITSQEFQSKRRTGFRSSRLCRNVFTVSRSPQQSVRGNTMIEAIS